MYAHYNKLTLRRTQVNHQPTKLADHWKKNPSLFKLPHCSKLNLQLKRVMHGNMPVTFMRDEMETGRWQEVVSI